MAKSAASIRLTLSQSLLKPHESRLPARIRHLQTRPDRRVIVEQPNDQRMRIGIGLVEAGEFGEGAAIRCRIMGAIERITVALAFEQAAQRILGRAKKQAKQR